MDMEFDKTIYDLTENFVVNTSSAKEHIYEIDISIRIVKERTQRIVTTTPFNYLRKLIITNIVYIFHSYG